MELNRSRLSVCGMGRDICLLGKLLYFSAICGIWWSVWGLIDPFLAIHNNCDLLSNLLMYFKVKFECL